MEDTNTKMCQVCGEVKPLEDLGETPIFGSDITITICRDCYWKEMGDEIHQEINKDQDIREL